MPNFLRATVFTILLSTLTSVATAGWVFDPYLGVPFGTWKQERTGPTYSLEGRGYSVGYGYGLRAAYVYERVFFGFEYAQKTLQWKYSKVDTSTTDDTWRDVNATATSIGPIIGFFGKTYHAWFSYFLRDQLTFSEDIDPLNPAPSYSGTALALGFGREIFGKFYLNFEYQMHTNTDVPANTTGVTQKALNSTCYYITISLPLYWHVRSHRSE